MEMAGSTRTKRRKRQRNSPIVPANVDQSQNVGRYIPHELGRKSLCSEITTITNRSSHIPTFTTSASTNTVCGLTRTRRDQSSCGTTMLQKSSAQYAGQYGPVKRLSDR